MKSKSTAIWFVLAVLLAAFTWLWQKHWRPAPPVVALLLPALQGADITGVEVIPAGAMAIDVGRINGHWELQKPFDYPAQSTAIQTLITELEKLTPDIRLTAAETGSRKNIDAEYGFDNPQFSLTLSAGEQQWQLRVGKNTAPGDQVFVRVVGVDGVYVTSTQWLQYLPHAAVDWRDNSLVDSSKTFNVIVITNGTKVIELRRSDTNQFWRMTRPLDARADSDHIIKALRQLQSSRVTRFVSDDPKADLASYGLQPASLDLWLGTDTNLTDGIHLGKSVTDDPALVYGKRENWNSIFTVTNDLFSSWRSGVNDFRDRQLLELTTPVAEIDWRGSSHLTLMLTNSNAWRLADDNFPIDAGTVGEFLHLLGSLRIVDFVKDNNTATDLQNFGLTAPGGTNVIRLFAVPGNTNTALAELIFGAIHTNEVYVKRADENYVYALSTDDLNRLKVFSYDWFFRERHIWNFSETNVAQVILRQNGQTRTLSRTGANLWDLTAGQGTITPAAVEEAVHRLSQLTVMDWVGKNPPASDVRFDTNNLQLTIVLKSGEKYSVAFGPELTRLNSALAEVTMEGDRWAFIFPPITYQYVSTYLTIPPSTP